MAKRITGKSIVGSLVYKPYEPLSPGKILSIKTITVSGFTRIMCEVKFLNGSIEIVDDLSLQDFDFHTEEHLKKYKKFNALRKKLKNI